MLRFFGYEWWSHNTVLRITVRAQPPPLAGTPDATSRQYSTRRAETERDRETDIVRGTREKILENLGTSAPLLTNQASALCLACLRRRRGAQALGKTSDEKLHHILGQHFFFMASSTKCVVAHAMPALARLHVPGMKRSQ